MYGNTENINKDYNVLEKKGFFFWFSANNISFLFHSVQIISAKFNKIINLISKNVTNLVNLFKICVFSNNFLFDDFNFWLQITRFSDSQLSYTC